MRVGALINEISALMKEAPTELSSPLLPGEDGTRPSPESNNVGT